MSQPPPPPPPPPPGDHGTGAPGPAAGDPHAPPVAPLPDPGPAPIAPVGDQPLAREVMTLWRLGGLPPVAVLLLGALVTAAVFGGLVWLAPAAALALAVLVVGVLPPVRYRRWRWRMTDRALELEQGVVVRQVRALPYFRIQHIDVDHGPLDRWLGLASLQVHTASVSALLPGLRADQAPGIRAALLERAGQSVAAAERLDDAV